MLEKSPSLVHNEVPNEVNLDAADPLTLVAEDSEELNAAGRVLR